MRRSQSRVSFRAASLACLLLSQAALGCFESEEQGGRWWPFEPARVESIDALADRAQRAGIAFQKARLDFDASDSAQLLSGWSSPEKRNEGRDTWVWSNAREAKIALPLFDTFAGGQVLTFRAQPHLWAGGPGQTLEVLINDAFVGRFELARGVKRYSLAVPGTSLVRGANVIEFRFGHATAPAEVSASLDARTLSVAFHELEIGAVPERGGEEQAASAVEAAGKAAPVEDKGPNLTRPISVDGVLAQSVGTRLVFRVAVPLEPTFQFSVARGPGTSAVDSPVAAEVLVRQPGVADVLVFSEPFEEVEQLETAEPVEEVEQLETAEAEQVALRTVDLSAWAGQHIELVLSVSAARNALEDEITGIVWSNPVVAGERDRAMRSTRCAGCNVLLVTMDTLRADHLGAYGYGRETSPEIDDFARRSTVFTRNLSQSGTTVTSIPSIHTAKFPSADRILGPAVGGDEEGRVAVLREDEVTLAEVLSESGYATMAVIANPYAGCEWGVCQGFEVVDDDFDWPEDAADTMRRVDDMLDQVGEEPFFLWVHFREPHTPYRPPASTFHEVYDSAVSGPTYYSDSLWPNGFAGESEWILQRPGVLERLNAYYVENAAEQLSTYRTEAGELDMTETVLRQVVGQYDGGIRVVDGEFGRLLDRIEQMEATDDTIVVVASDHGESLGERKFVGHNRLDYPVLHTPLIIRSPGRGPATVDDGVMNVDIFPTILSELGLDSPAGIRGWDLFSMAGRRSFQYAEYQSSRAIVVDRHKLVVVDGMREADYLSEILADPGESVNLAERSSVRIGGLMDRIEAVQSTSLALDPEVADPDVIEMLRSLGYIHD